jgi:hypothetical protein
MHHYARCQLPRTADRLPLRQAKLVQQIASIASERKLPVGSGDLIIGLLSTRLLKRSWDPIQEIADNACLTG